MFADQVQNTFTFGLLVDLAQNLFEMFSALLSLIYVHQSTIHNYIPAFALPFSLPQLQRTQWLLMRALMT
jgi:hypothetical protein